MMSLKPGEDIGLEVHKKIDQILIFVQGTGEAIIGGQMMTLHYQERTCHCDRF